MDVQLKWRVCNDWGVEDAERQLRRYGDERFRAALEAFQDIDPWRLEDPSGLLLHKVRDLAVKHYREQGVNPSLLAKIPGGRRDEPPYITPGRSVPWHPLLGPATGLDTSQSEWGKQTVRLPAPTLPLCPV